MSAPCFLDGGGAVGVEDGGQRSGASDDGEALDRRLGEEFIGRLAEQVVAEVAARKSDELLSASRKRCAMEGFGEHDGVGVMASNSLEKFFLTRHNDKDKRRSLLATLHWRVTAIQTSNLANLSSAWQGTQPAVIALSEEPPYRQMTWEHSPVTEANHACDIAGRHLVYTLSG